MFKSQCSLRIIESVIAVPQPSTTSLLYLVIFCFSKQNRGDMVPSDSMELTLVYNQVGSRDNSFQTEKPGLHGQPPLHVVVDSGNKFTGVLLSLLKIKKGEDMVPCGPMELTFAYCHVGSQGNNFQIANTNNLLIDCQHKKTATPEVHKPYGIVS